MTANSFFRCDEDGRVVGITDADEAVARRNLTGVGHFLLPFDSAVDPRQQRYDRRKKAWVARDDTASPLEDDPIFMRRTAYSTMQGDQVGVLMKLAGYALAGEPVPDAVRAEFDALQKRIGTIKATYRKPDSPST